METLSVLGLAETVYETEDVDLAEKSEELLQLLDSAHWNQEDKKEIILELLQRVKASLDELQTARLENDALLEDNAQLRSSFEQEVRQRRDAEERAIRLECDLEDVRRHYQGVTDRLKDELKSESAARHQTVHHLQAIERREAHLRTEYKSLLSELVMHNNSTFEYANNGNPGRLEENNPNGEPTSFLPSLEQGPMTEDFSFSKNLMLSEKQLNYMATGDHLGLLNCVLSSLKDEKLPFVLNIAKQLPLDISGKPIEENTKSNSFYSEQCISKEMLANHNEVASNVTTKVISKDPTGLGFKAPKARTKFSLPPTTIIRSETFKDFDSTRNRKTSRNDSLLKKSMNLTENQKNSNSDSLLKASLNLAVNQQTSSSDSHLKASLNLELSLHQLEGNKSAILQPTNEKRIKSLAQELAEVSTGGFSLQNGKIFPLDKMEKPISNSSAEENLLQMISRGEEDDKMVESQRLKIKDAFEGMQGLVLSTLQQINSHKQKIEGEITQMTQVKKELNVLSNYFKLSSESKKESHQETQYGMLKEPMKESKFGKSNLIHKIRNCFQKIIGMLRNEDSYLDERTHSILVYNDSWELHHPRGTKVSCATLARAGSQEVAWLGCNTEEGSSVTLVSMTDGGIMAQWECCESHVLSIVATEGDIVWIGTEKGHLMVFSSLPDFHLVHRADLMHHVPTLATTPRRVFAGLSNGSLVIFMQDHKGTWDFNAYRQIIIGRSPITCIKPIESMVWVASHNKINFISPYEIKVKNTFHLKEGVVKNMAIVTSSNNVWLSFANSGVIFLHDIDTFQKQQAFDVAEYIRAVMNEDKSEVSILEVAGGNIWIGTWQGAVLHGPLSAEGRCEPSRLAMALNAHRRPAAVLLRPVNHVVILHVANGSVQPRSPFPPTFGMAGDQEPEDVHIFAWELLSW